MKSVVVTAALLIALLFPGTNTVPLGYAQRGDALNRLMQEKLTSAKTLLEGIALGDFNKISRSAEKLHQISKTAEWMVHKSMRYELHSNEFRRATESVMEKAKDKNLDGVTLAYFELTMSCVRCHTYVREVRDARVPFPMPLRTTETE